MGFFARSLGQLAKTTPIDLQRFLIGFCGREDIV